MLHSFARDYRSALARFAPDARRLVAAVALSAFARQSFFVLRNLYLKELGEGEDRIGFVVSALSVGQAAIAIPAIVIMSRLGLRRGLIAAMVFEGAAAAVQASSTALLPILVATGVAGAASTLHIVIGQPFLMRVSSPEERPYLFSVTFTAMMLGGALGASTGGLLQEVFARLAGDAVTGFRLALGASALAYAGAVPFLLRLEQDDPPAEPRGASLLDSLRIRAPSRVALLAIPEAIIGVGAGMTIPFLQLYFRNTFHQGSAAIGAIYMLGSAGMAAGYLVAPAIARRTGARRVIVGSQFISILFFAELAFPHGLPLAIAAFVLRTTFMNLAAPVSSQYALELVDPADQRTVSSVLSLVRGVTWGSANALGGWLIHARGGNFSLAIMITSVLYVIAAATGARVYGRLERTKSLEPRLPLEDRR